MTEYTDILKEETESELEMVMMDGIPMLSLEDITILFDDNYDYVLRLACNAEMKITVSTDRNDNPCHYIHICDAMIITHILGYKKAVSAQSESVIKRKRKRSIQR